MNLTDFDFTLPDELIAHYPATPRDSSRLLVIGQNLEEKLFHDLPSLLRPADLLIFNNSKVIPARLFATNGKRNFEILLHRKIAQNKWQAFAKPGKRLKVGDLLSICHPVLVTGSSRAADAGPRDEDGVTVLEKLETGEIIIQFTDEFIIQTYGHMPLPPYIKRQDQPNDRQTYQTIYAQSEGSVAAPTAGLHFTPGLMAKIPNKAFVTLHVGAGTFQPVKTENITDHKMHHEYYEIPPETAEAIKTCKGRVIAVGTTSLRVLEASAGEAGSGETDIFITPGYKFRVADALITNFHLPKSTLFILTCALAGREKMQEAYQYAIQNKFRFYSYGDACFIAKSVTKL